MCLNNHKVKAMIVNDLLFSFTFLFWHALSAFSIPGLVLNNLAEDYYSVKVEDCPCVHKRRIYAPGHRRSSKCQIWWDEPSVMFWTNGVIWSILLIVHYPGLIHLCLCFYLSECFKGKWMCSPNTCPLPCVIEGWFVTTFDGKEYPLPGKCTYVAARVCKKNE